MNQYETVFILTPVLSDVQMKEAVEKFKGILTAEGAEIVNEENWGLKKLAYPIQKKSTGFYQLIEFNAEPTVIEKLEINFRRDERVIRFLTFKQRQVTCSLHSLSYTTLELQRSTGNTTRKDFTLLIQEFLQEFRVFVVDVLNTALFETAVFFLLNVY